jgi:hypothetical protein
MKASVRISGTLKNLNLAMLISIKATGTANKSIFKIYITIPKIMNKIEVSL